MKLLSVFTPLLLLLIGGQSVATIPVETLFRKPEFSGFQLSPSGQYLAVLAPYERRANIHVIDLATMKIERITNVKNTDIFSYFWANNDRLIFRMDNGGDRFYGMFAVDRDGKNPVTIIPLLNTRDANFNVPRFTNVVDLLEDENDLVLVSNNDRISDYPDVYLLNIRTGRKKMILVNPGNVTGWLADQNGVVRIGVTRDLTDVKSRRSGIIYRSNEDEDFRVIQEFKSEFQGVQPLLFDYDGETLYVRTSKDGEPYSINKYYPETATLGEELLSDDIFDAGRVGLSKRTKKLNLVAINKDKPEWFWMDPEKEQIQAALDQSFPDTLNIIVSMSDDETRMVVASTSSRQPPFYNLLKLENGSLSLTKLGFSKEWINPDLMGKQEPFTFEARDGLELRGYLWFPVDSDRENLPLIVHPHGGPNARDNYGWNERIQYFVNRGFIVMQVNFRASDGFGPKFIKLGHKKWGDEMQWDVYDAVQWAIKQGYVDPEKIGIYGGSYGGYTVMSQLVQYPDLYQFGINVVGVVDLEEMLKYEESVSDEIFAFWQTRIGDLKEDIDLIRRFSPSNHVEKIDDPVFIIHGVRDPVVPIKQAEILRGRMRGEDKNYEWLVKANEGHGFFKEENVILQFNQIEEFIEPFMKKWGMN